MKSAASHYPQPYEPRVFNPTKRGMQAADEDLAGKEAKRHARLLQLRNELLADMSNSDDDQPMTSFRNPFTQKKVEPLTEAPVPQPIIKAKSLEEALTTRHDVPHSADLDGEEPDGLLSEAELVLLGRVRRLVEASAPKPKKNTVVRPEVVPPEKPPSIFPSRDTVTRLADEEKGSNPDPRIKPPMPYDKECRRRRRDRRCERTDAGGKATEHHDGEDLDDASNSDPSAGQTRDQEAPAEESKDHENTQRTSHNGLQIRSQVVPKRHVRSIPGRFSALDSDEEEEWFRQYDMEQAKRKAQREAQGTSGINGSSTVAHGIANGLQQTLPSDAFGQAGQAGHHGQQSGYPGYHGVPNYRLPPQIYPTLQYGRRTRLYHPKLDEVLAWTSSGDFKPLVLDTWRCRTCDHRTNVLSSKCDRCDAPKPGAVNGDERTLESQRSQQQQLHLQQQQIQELKMEIQQLQQALRQLQLQPQP